MNLKSIETERLVLRMFKPSDIDDMWEWCTDPDVGPNAGWPVHKTREFTIQMLTHFIVKGEVYAIYHKASDKVIGSIGAHKRNSGNEYDVEVGYVLNKNFWSKGYMTEAAKALITFLFEETDIFRISISHFSINDRSRRVIEKIGFKYEGTRRKARITPNGVICDSVIYGMLKEDFEEIKESWEKKDEN